jgi:hypothetical protein
MLSSHVRLVLPGGRFPSGFPTIILFLTMCATYSANFTPLLRILMALVWNGVTVSCDDQTEEESCVSNKMVILVEHII